MHMHTCIYVSPQLVHARLCNGAAGYVTALALQCPREIWGHRAVWCLTYPSGAAQLHRALRFLGS